MKTSSLDSIQRAFLNFSWQGIPMTAVDVEYQSANKELGWSAQIQWGQLHLSRDVGKTDVTDMLHQAVYASIKETLLQYFVGE